MNLVVYFSTRGRTKLVAEEIAKKVNGDLFEIVPETIYTDEDLDWTNEESRSSVEMRDKSSRPKISSRLEDISKYDTIYLGFPIWWGVAPTIVNTFLESYDFSRKTIITFATSGSSSIGNSTEELKKSALNANFINGKVLSVNDVENFINEVNR